MIMMASHVPDNISAIRSSFLFGFTMIPHNPQNRLVNWPMNIANPNVIDRETGKLMFLPNSVTQAIGTALSIRWVKECKISWLMLAHAWNHFIPLLSSVAAGSWPATRTYGSIHQELEKDEPKRAIPVEIGNIIPHLSNRKVSMENIFFRNK